MADSTVLAHARNTSDAELARMAFLARYQNPTRRLYEVDLRLFFAWCAEQHLDPLDVRRADLERFAEHCAHVRGNKPGTVRHRLMVLRAFYRLCFADELIPRDPTVMLRIPKAPRDPDALVWLDRFQVGAILRAARATSPAHHALIGLMAMAGLRVSAACGARLEHIRTNEYGEHVLDVREKGGRIHHAVIPPALHRIIEAARDGRTEGYIVRRRSGEQQTRNGAADWVRRLAKKAGVHGRVHPHAFRRHAITLAIDSGMTLQDARDFGGHADTRTTELYHPRRGAAGVRAAYTVAAVLDAVA